MSQVVDHETGEVLDVENSAEYWAEQINASWQKSVSAILDTATLVHEALSQQGVLTADLVPRLSFGETTLKRLWRIGADSRLLSYAGGGAHAHVLPQSRETLYELSLLDDEQWAVAETGGGKGGLPLLRPDVERKEVTHFRNYASRGVKEPPPLPKGKYTVIYADPPWQYDFSKSDSREIENQYPTMTVEEICDLDIESITAPNCVLFLWATSPKLTEAFRVIDAWGFKYKTCAIWDKQKIGMGYYFRQQHELLLVATVGSPAAPPAESRLSSVIAAPRGEHSAKPPAVYEAIESMYPPSEKTHIELFVREKKRAKWKSWGNQ